MKYIINLTINYTGMKKDYKNYDLSPLNDFFNESTTPMQLDYEINELMYEYASCTENADKGFKDNVGTLYMLHNILIEIARLNGETDI